MDTLNILVPKKKIITFAGKQYELGPLTFEQIVKLGRHAPEVVKDLRAGNINTDWDVLLLALNGNALPGAISILLNDNFEQKDMPKILATEVGELLAALSELNDFEKDFANFQKGMALFAKMFKAGPTV